jgi:hypothetical protein
MTEPASIQLTGLLSFGGGGLTLRCPDGLKHKLTFKGDAMRYVGEQVVVVGEFGSTGRLIVESIRKLP